MRKNGTLLIFVGCMLSLFVSSLDQTIVTTAMPQIVRELDGLSQMSWVFTAYMLASTVIIPISGKVGDIMGRRGFFVAGIIVFLVGSALSGYSQNMAELIMFRGLQGLGGGTMMVNTFTTVGDIFPPAERGKWQGLMTGVFGLSSIAGPLIGGWITDNFSWRWIFYINIPIGIIAISVILSAMPRIARQRNNRKIDFTGAILLAAGLIPLLLAFVWGGSEYSWGSWHISMLWGLSVVVFGCLAIVELRVREPIISMGLFKNKVFAVCTATAFVISAGFFGAIIYIPLFAQGVIGVSATNSGLIMVPMMGAMMIASAISGQIVSRTGKYKLVVVLGSVFSVAAMFLFSQLNTATTNTDLSLRMILMGLGQGMVMPILTIAVQSAFGAERLGEVTAGNQLFRSIGMTMGTAILGGIMNSQLTLRLVNIAKEPFVIIMNQLNPSMAITSIDSNSVQNFLTPQGQAQINSLIGQAPAPVQSSFQTSFVNFLDSIRSSFSQSMDRVFLVGSILMFIALIIILFLPEIPLRKTQQTTATAGMQTEATTLVEAENKSS